MDQPSAPPPAESGPTPRPGDLTPERLRQVRARLIPRLMGAVFMLVIFGGALLCFGLGFLGLLLEEPEPGLFGLLLFGLVFGGALVWGVSQAWRPALAMLDLMDKRLEQADGRLTWRGRAYFGKVEGRADLHLLPGDERMPGGYRFYFLPRSGYIIDTERLFLGGTDSDMLAELRRALQDEFYFVDDDVPENQAGQLSARQRPALLWRHLRDALVYAPFMLLFSGLTCAFPFSILLQPWLQGERIAADDWAPALIPAAIGLLVALVLIWMLVAPVPAILRGEVKSITGGVDKQVITTGSGKNRRTNYYYVVGGQRFQVSVSAHTALIEHRRYRLYYLAGSNQIVSVEPLA